MSSEKKNNILLKSLTAGMLLAGPIAIAAGTTAYSNPQASSAKTYSSQAVGEAEAEGEAVHSSAKTYSSKATGEAEGAAYGEAEGEAVHSSAKTYSGKATGEAEGAAYGEAESSGKIGSSYGQTQTGYGEAETGYGEAESTTLKPTNCPPGTTPQNDGTCLLG